MKRYLLYLAGLSLCVSIACKDEKETPLSELLIGTWTATSNMSQNCTDTLDNESTSITCDSLNCFKLIITDSLLTEFTIVNGDSSTRERIWDIVGDLLEICDSDAPDATCSERTAIIDGKELRLKSPKDEDGCDFTEVFSRD